MTRTSVSLSLRALVWPIFFENIIRTSLTSVDQLMLYAFSEEAAAAMSTVNQMSFFIQILYQMVAVGSSILIAQNLGAGKREEAGRTALASLVMTVILAAFLSTAVALSAPFILGSYGLEPLVQKYATDFLVIYGAGSIFMAINIAQSSILRAIGRPGDPMVVNIVALFLTIAGNAIALFGPFGLPVFGVAGVAVSTVFSQFVAAILSHILLERRKAEIRIEYREVLKLSSATYRGILGVGIPTAGENLSYNVAQIVIVSFIAKMGTATLAAYGLVVTLSRYVFIGGVSIGAATQIMVGYLVGQGRYDTAYRKVYRWFGTGLAVSVTAIIALNLLSGPIIGIFTEDAKIAAIAVATLLVGLALEPARNFNLIVIPALKGSGDVRFPVYVGLVSMWAVGAFGAWFFGLHMGLGLAGVWLGMASDEWTRGIIMIFRWKSGRWRTKSLVRTR